MALMTVLAQDYKKAWQDYRVSGIEEILLFYFDLKILLFYYEILLF
jgi:hypothetical protein